MSAETVRPEAMVTPERLGIGMRFSLHPHCDDFVEIIVGALEEAHRSHASDGLQVETDDVSTYVGAIEAPAEQRLMGYLATVIGAASRRSGGGHVAAHVVLSRGCPGEVTCDTTSGSLPCADPLELPATGVPAVAHWALYPLLDGDSNGGSHMDHIKAAIDAAAARGTVTGTAHYVTRLHGDVAQVLAATADGWARLGSRVPHVVSHLTISVGSPGAVVTS